MSYAQHNGFICGPVLPSSTENRLAVMNEEISEAKMIAVAAKAFGAENDHLYLY